MMASLKGFKDWLKLREQEMELTNLAIGMNSTVDYSEDKHIVMLDFDIKNIAKVTESINELQEFWNLGDADIFETKHGHHVFFWYDQVPYERLRMIVNFARYVDPMYKYISKYYNHKTIRVSGKYKNRDIWYRKTIKGKRKSTQDERDIGDMKKQEHAMLIRS